MQIAAIFKLLVGSWRLQRTLSNHSQVEGVANFHELGAALATLHYQETGIITLVSGLKTKIYQAYSYCLLDKQIKVYFLENGNTSRLFHSLNFKENSTALLAEATGFHQCKQDSYEVSYQFFNDKHFNITYRVTGPEKNYTSSTDFFRIEPSLNPVKVSSSI